MGVHLLLPNTQVTHLYQAGRCTNTTQNALKLTILRAKSNFFLRRGNALSPDSFPPHPSPHPTPFDASILMPKALDLGASSALLPAYTHFYI